MKDFNTIEKFIRLRASGMTYEEITEEIDVSRPTLVKWNKEYSGEIREAEKALFVELFSRKITYEEDQIIFNTVNLNRYAKLDRKSSWADEVASRAFEKLSKIFLKDIASANLVFSNSEKIKEIKFEFLRENEAYYKKGKDGKLKIKVVK